MGYSGITYITERQISEMLLLAEDVAHAIRFQHFLYNENGVYVSVVDDDTEFRKRLDDTRINFLDKLYKNDRYSLCEIEEMDADDIKALLTPEMLKMVVGIFRNGIESEPPSSFREAFYVAAPTVPDEYLEDIFAMKVREKMIYFAAVKKYFVRKEDEQ